MVQCDQIEQLLKVFGQKYSYKISQIFGDIRAILKTPLFEHRMLWILFDTLLGDIWAILKTSLLKHRMLWILFDTFLGDIGLLFILTSGHTGVLGGGQRME